MTSMPPPVPKGASPAGERLWLDLTGRFQLDARETVMLTQAVATLAIIEELQETIDAAGVMITGADGQPRTNPAVPEIRQSRITLARLLAALAVPEPEEQDVPAVARRRPARPAFRGVYKLPGAS